MTVLHKVSGAHKVRHPCCLGYAIITVITDSRLCLLSSLRLGTLGCHDNNTISCTRTIDGCRRSVFKYVNSLNVLRIKPVNIITDDTINNIKWVVVATHSWLTTDFNVKSTASSAWWLCDTYTRNRTLKVFHHCRCTFCVQLFGVNRCDSTRKVTLLHCAVTNNYHVAKCCCIIFEHNINRCLVANLYGLCLHTDVRNLKRTIALQLDCKITVEVRNSTITSALFQYGCTYHGFSAWILHINVNGLLRKGKETNKRHKQSHWGSFNLLLHNLHFLVSVLNNYYFFDSVLLFRCKFI